MKKSADTQPGSVRSESVLSKDMPAVQAHNARLSDKELHAGMMSTGTGTVFILASPDHDRVRAKECPGLFSLTTIQLLSLVDRPVGTQGLAEATPA